MSCFSYQKGSFPANHKLRTIDLFPRGWKEPIMRAITILKIFRSTSGFEHQLVWQELACIKYNTVHRLPKVENSNTKTQIDEN